MLFLLTLFNLAKSYDVDSLLDEVSSLRLTVSELTSYFENEILGDVISNLRQSMDDLKEEIGSLYLSIIQAKYGETPIYTYANQKSDFSTPRPDLSASRPSCYCNKTNRLSNNNYKTQYSSDCIPEPNIIRPLIMIVPHPPRHSNRSNSAKPKRIPPPFISAIFKPDRFFNKSNTCSLNPTFSLISRSSRSLNCSQYNSDFPNRGLNVFNSGLAITVPFPARFFNRSNSQHAYIHTLPASSCVKPFQLIKSKHSNFIPTNQVRRDIAHGVNCIPRPVYSPKCYAFDNVLKNHNSQRTKMHGATFISPTPPRFCNTTTQSPQLGKASISSFVRFNSDSSIKLLHQTSIAGSNDITHPDGCVSRPCKVTDFPLENSCILTMGGLISMRPPKAINQSARHTNMRRNSNSNVMLNKFQYHQPPVLKSVISNEFRYDFLPSEFGGSISKPTFQANMTRTNRIPKGQEALTIHKPLKITSRV